LLLTSIVFNIIQYNQLQELELEYRTSLVNNAVVKGLDESVYDTEKILTEWDTTSDLEKIQMLSNVSSDLHIAESMFKISEDDPKSYFFISLLFRQYKIEIQSLENQLVEYQDLPRKKILAIHNDLKTLKNNLSKEKMYTLPYSELKKYWSSLIEKLEYRDVLEVYHSHPLT